MAEATASLRVAVVTPYHGEPDDWLRQCHDSVRAQTYPCTQILVADGRPNPLVDTFDVQHIRLSLEHNDFGDTPRSIGSLSAVAQGFDAITYLDADNWYADDHIARLIQTHLDTGAAVCTSGRAMHQLDGAYMGQCMASDGEQFCDTSCLMLLKEARRLGAAWAMLEPIYHAIDDRVVWHLIKTSGLARAHTGAPTLKYRQRHRPLYRLFGLPEPPGVTDVDRRIDTGLKAWLNAGHGDVEWRWSVPKDLPGRRR